MRSSPHTLLAPTLRPAAASADVLAWLRRHPALSSSVDPPVSALATLAALDHLLGGGLPAGAISELVGPGSAGRTSLALAIAAAVTCRAERAAWVDPADALDPRSAEQAGVLLAHFLWIRPPRDAPLTVALKAADLVLDAGGFALLVLDWAGRGDRPPGSRPAWWLRLARRLRGQRTALLVLSAHPQTGASAALRLACHGRRWRTRVTVLKHRGHPPGDVAQLALAPPAE